MFLDIHKWADHLHLLNAHGERLLHTLASLKHSLAPPSAPPLSDVSFTYNTTIITPIAPPRPPAEVGILKDPGLQDLWKKVNKAFPGDVGEKWQKSFEGVSERVDRELGDWYRSLVATAEFLDTSGDVLRQVVDIGLSYEVNPDLVTLFFDLFVAHVLVAHLFSTLHPYTKTIASSYNKSHQLFHGESHPAYSLVCQCILSYTQPLPTIQSSLTDISSKIFGLLMEMKLDLDILNMNADSFRKLATLSLMPEMSGVKAPEADEKVLRGVRGGMRLFRVVVLVFLCFPGEVGRYTGAGDVLKSTLAYGWMVPVVRNEMMNIATEFEGSKAHRKVSGMKGLVSETLAATMTSAPVFHKDRRDYLRHQLKQMLCLCKDQRVVCQKFPMVASALGFARDEVLWYFHHLEHDPSSTRRKSARRTVDIGAIELIYLIKSLAHLLLSEIDLIRDALARQISEFYASNLVGVLETASEGVPGEQPLGVMLDEVLRIVRSCVTDLNEGDLESLRLNWKRVQVCAALNDSPNIVGNETLVWLLGDLCERSKWLDSFQESIQALSTFSDLYFYQHSLFEHLQACLEVSPDYARHTGMVGHLSEDFPLNATSMYPAEEKPLVVHSVCFATEVFSILAQFAAGVTHDIALESVTMEAQTLSTEVKHFVSNAKERKKKKKETVRKPGWESVLNGENTGHIRELERRKMVLRGLLHALTHPLVTTVYDTEFHPFEFYLESLAEVVRHHLISSVYKTPEAPSASGFGLGSSSPNDDGLSFDVKRPSVYWTEIEAYMKAIRDIDCLVPMSCTAAVKEVLLDQIASLRAKEFAETQPDAMVFPVTSTKKPVRSKGTPSVNIAQPVLTVYMAWISELVATRATNGTVCFSHPRRSFVSRNGMAFQAETYTDINELMALCKIVGPHGVAFIDEKLCRMVASLVTATRDMIYIHQDILERFSQSWMDDGRVGDIFKRVRAIKDLTKTSVTLGFLLEFRRLLMQAVRCVFGERCNGAFTLVKTAHNYGTGLGKEVGGAVIDGLANRMGLVHNIDGSLEEALRGMHVPSDAAAWPLLPYLYTLALYHLSCDETATYNPYIDGLENNGHCLSATFSALLPRTPNGNGVDVFLTTASNLIMKLIGGKEKGNVESMAVVLKRFIVETPQLNRSTVESTYLPHATFQIVAADMHRRRQDVLAGTTKRTGLTPAQSEEDVAF
ncbi:Nck-associated protein 1 [Gaertneriomyces semiglobifer]|nr:Nck-associated protein 1 [Gaertneriomyces semiglobifer]